MATEARAIRAGSKGPGPEQGPAISLPTGPVAQTMPARLSLAEHHLVGRAHPESWGGAILREKPPILHLHVRFHSLQVPIYELSM